MTREEVIEILENEMPHCGEKVVYTEEERCEAYEIALSALREQEERRWIPVTERLPEKLTPVLIMQNYKEWGGITVGYITKCGYWEWFAYFMGDDMLHYPMGGGTICPGNEYVTHWMPLPEPPKGE